MKVKLVAESLEENKYQRLNEELNMVSESILADFKKLVKDTFSSLVKKWEGVNKEDEKSVREFALSLVLKTYVANNPEQGKKLLKKWAEVFSIESIKAFCEKAAKDRFFGRTKVTYVNKKLTVDWVKMEDIQLANPFASGGTSGKTGMGGV
jgi:hypothetical protein